jgi:MFS family permease
MRGWLPRFSPDYWKFYSGAFCFDFGFGLFFFLFNLYLTDLHFDERAIGRIVACITLGNIAGTLPATLLARRRGLRPLLLIVFVAAPCACAMRLMASGETAQMALAFVTGMALCPWPICFSPTLATLTNESNRARGFSLAFATGIGLGTLSGLAGGYIPEWLQKGSAHLSLVGGVQAVLLGSCAVALAGTIPVLRLKFADRAAQRGKRGRLFHPYLFRFLPPFLLWNVVTGSFPIFGAVYLQKVLGLPLGRLGAVFAASQLLQFVAVLCAPFISKRVGVANGVAIALLGAAVFLGSIVFSHTLPVAVSLYLMYFAAQYMCGPGIYQMLMESVPEEDRSTASALQNLSGALCQAATAALTGICIVRFGYGNVMLTDAGVALLAGVSFVLLGRSARLVQNALISSQMPAAQIAAGQAAE